MSIKLFLVKFAIMIQIIITPNNKYSLGEMAQMAVEAGAMWLQLRVPDISDEELREACTDIITLCRESGVILTVEDRVDMARELGLHGVFLHTGAQSPISVRQDMGPEAIIGAEIGSPDTALALAGADIDYVALHETGAQASALINEIRKGNCEIPVVAYMPGAELTSDSIDAILGEGFNGICTDGNFFDGSDPVAAIEAILKKQLG